MLRLTDGNRAVGRGTGVSQVSPEFLAELLAKIDPRRLALSLTAPIRCGGREYLPDGTSRIRIGGKWLTDLEFEGLKKQLSQQKKQDLKEYDEELARKGDSVNG